ncbi:hypothetical protein KL867_14545, partial [Ruegeria litorea]
EFFNRIGSERTPDSSASQLTLAGRIERQHCADGELCKVQRTALSCRSVQLQNVAFAAHLADIFCERVFVGSASQFFEGLCSPWVFSFRLQSDNSGQQCVCLQDTASAAEAPTCHVRPYFLLLLQ